MPVSGCVLPIVIVLSGAPGAELLPPPPPARLLPGPAGPTPPAPSPPPATAAAAAPGRGQRQYGASRQQADVGNAHVLPPWGSGRGRSWMRIYLAGLIRAIRRRTDPTIPPGATSMARASRTP